MSEKTPNEPTAKNSNSDDLVMNVDDDDEISEEQMNELIELTKGVVNIATVMNKFTNIMGGLKNMLENLTEHVNMLEEEISKLPQKEHKPMRFDIDENDTLDIKEAIKNEEHKEETNNDEKNNDDAP